MSTPDQVPQCPPVPDYVSRLCWTSSAASRWAKALASFGLSPSTRYQPAADWGFTQGLAAAQRLAAEEKQKGAAGWPEPITDRPPTEADGDVTQDGYASGMVQVLYHGLWDMCHWSLVGGRPWHHSPRWRPPAPSLREQALRDLYAIKDIMARQGLGITEERSLMFSRLRQALEEAGDER